MYNFDVPQCVAVYSNTQHVACHQARYESGFRHDTAIDQAESQHATPFDLALDTGTCKAGKCQAVRG